MARAIDYINSIGFENIEAHEQELTCYCIEQMKTIEGLTVYGPSLDSHDAGVSFNIFAPFPTGVGERPIHHMDIGTLLDRFGIAVRTGHHCAQPLMDRLGILGTVRASFAVYNTKEEIDSLVTALRRIIPMF